MSGLPTTTRLIHFKYSYKLSKSTSERFHYISPKHTTSDSTSYRSHYITCHKQKIFHSFKDQPALQAMSGLHITTRLVYLRYSYKLLPLTSERLHYVSPKHTTSNSTSERSHYISAKIKTTNKKRVAK